MPSYVKAPVGTSIAFTCKYSHKERLTIQVLEDGTSVWRKTDFYTLHKNGGSRSWYSTVGYNERKVECVVKDKDDIAVGLVSARIHPGLMTHKKTIKNQTNMEESL